MTYNPDDLHKELHKCALPACPRQIKSHHLLCWQHFSRLDAAQQAELGRRFRAAQERSSMVAESIFKQTLRECIAVIEARERAIRERIKA